MLELILISLIGAICSLDNSMVGNIMISRPIIVAPIIGFITKDFRTAIEIGLILEFLFADVLYAGTAIPINLTMLTTIILGCNYLLPRYDPAFSMFIIVLAIPMVFICRQVEIGLRIFNSYLASDFEEKTLADKKYNRVYFAIFHGVFIFTFTNFVLLFTCIAIISDVAKTLYLQMDYNIVRALKYTYMTLPVIGFSVLTWIFASGSFRANVNKFKVRIMNKQGE